MFSPGRWPARSGDNVAQLGVITGRTFANTGVVLMARVVGQDSANITVASITGISYLVRDLDAKTSGSISPLVVAAVVFDALQTGNGWVQDATGYNFRTVIPAAAFNWTPETDPGNQPKPRRFQIEVRFVPDTGEQFVIVFGLWVHPTWIN